MPNWCINSLEVQGPPSLVEAFIDNASGPNASRRQATHGQQEFGIGEEEKVPSLSLHQLEPEPQHVSNTQHVLPWRRNCWGIKWDLGTDVQRERPAPDRVVYRFDSPWGPPLDAMERIIRHFPGLSWALRYLEQGNGLYGNTGWRGDRKVFDQAFSQQGYLAFAEEIFGITHHDPEEPPDEAYQLEQDILGPPDPPVGLVEKQLQELIEISDSRKRRGKLRDWLADSPSRARDLATAAVVMPQVDYWTARELVEKTGQPEVLRHAKGFTEGAHEYLQQWALEGLLGAPPETVQNLENFSRLAGLFQPRPLSIEERIKQAQGEPELDSQKGKDTKWAGRFQVGARLLRRLLSQEKGELTPQQHTKLQKRRKQWGEVDSRIGQGVKQVLGSLLLESELLDSETLENLLEEAPEGSLYHARILEHPETPMESLQEGLSGLKRQHEYTRCRIARRACQAQDFSLVMALLTHPSSSATTFRVLFEGTHNREHLEKMTRTFSKHRPEEMLKLLKQMSSETSKSLQGEWLMPLLTQDNLQIREKAFKLLGRLGPEGEQWDINELPQAVQDQKEKSSSQQTR